MLVVGDPGDEIPVDVEALWQVIGRIIPFGFDVLLQPNLPQHKWGRAAPIALGEDRISIVMVIPLPAYLLPIGCRLAAVTVAIFFLFTSS
jgi:hypothetical protein